jgi:hypothetical protein
MALVLTGIVSAWWMRPLMSLSYDVLGSLLRPLATVLGR